MKYFNQSLNRRFLFKKSRATGDSVNIASSRISISIVYALLIPILFLTPVSYAYEPPVDFQETFNNIITVDQVSSWAQGKSVTMGRLAMSGDGSRVAFTVALNVCGDSPVCWKLYVVNADGSGLIDLTPSAEIGSIAYLRMNYDGSRLFYRFPVYGSFTDIYYCEVNSKSCAKAVKDGISGFDFRVPYSIDKYGQNLYFKHNAGWDAAFKTYRRGLYSAPVGGSKSQVMDLDELPCESECGNMNMLSFLDVASDTGSDLLFIFNQDYRGGNATGMWTIGAGAPALLGDNHTYIWSVQDIYGHLLSRDGKTALYSYTDKTETLNVIDMTTRQVKLLASGEFSGDVNSLAALSPDGRYARYQGHSYLTRVDTQDGSKRDLLSYYTKMRGNLWTGRVSNFSDNNHRYFIFNLSETGGPKLTRVDLDAPESSGNAPVIGSIKFSAPALLHANDGKIGVEVAINDPQGLGDIDQVRLITLVEGLEQADFSMGRKPLAFPTGDAGDTLLYDDGSHGDTSAGDGVYSFNAIATRKNDYDGWNTFYKQFTLPHPVGIRILAKDNSQNYALADVRLLITDNPADVTTEPPSSAHAAVVQQNFDVLLNPVDVFGQAYQVTLKHFNNPQDASGLYWKLGAYAITKPAASREVWLENDYSIVFQPVDVFGTLLDVKLIPWKNQQDPFNLYWTLGSFAFHNK